MDSVGQDSCVLPRSNLLPRPRGQVVRGTTRVNSHRVLCNGMAYQVKDADGDIHNPFGFPTDWRTR